MDNGIGSDMLSLGLPPLHVAPFFLYKEKCTSSKEIHGFSGWKTFFEVPHWMNLSFTAYNNEEEPMLYREHFTDDHLVQDSNTAQTENKSPWHVANGFLKLNTPKFVKPEFIAPASLAKQQYKRRISDRGFEDILQACR